MELITNQELVAIQINWYRDGYFAPKVTDIFHKLLLHIFARSSIIFRLIIQLETDDALSMCCALQQFSDYTFRIEKIYGMGNIHDLTGTVNTSSLYCLS